MSNGHEKDDPQPGRGQAGRPLLPRLVRIEGGEYDVFGLDSLFLDDQQSHRITLEAFEIGRHPVSNAEYACFMQAGGYDDKRWWVTAADMAWLQGTLIVERQRKASREGLKLLRDLNEESIRDMPDLSSEQIQLALHLRSMDDEAQEELVEWQIPPGNLIRQPAFWHDGHLNGPDQPVVGVSWFEARAYCAWLSDQTGWTIGLPSAVDWTVASQIGAWFSQTQVEPERTGNEMVSKQTEQAGSPSIPVSGGDSSVRGTVPFGGVWEWTASRYPLTPDTGGIDHQGEDSADTYLILCGGTQGRERTYARPENRDYIPPDNHNLLFGFRLLVRRHQSYEDNPLL